MHLLFEVAGCNCLHNAWPQCDIGVLVAELEKIDTGLRFDLLPCLAGAASHPFLLICQLSVTLCAADDTHTRLLSLPESAQAPFTFCNSCVSNHCSAAGACLHSYLGSRFVYVCAGREMASKGDRAAAAAGRPGRPPQGLHVSGRHWKYCDQKLSDINRPLCQSLIAQLETAISLHVGAAASNQRLALLLVHQF